MVFVQEPKNLIYGKERVTQLVNQGDFQHKDHGAIRQFCTRACGFTRAGNDNE